MICNIIKKGIGVGSVMFACATATPALATNTVEVPVVNRSMDSGEILTHDHLSVKTIELSHLPRGAVLTTEDLVGLELLRNMRAGMPVRSDQVRTPPEARRGETVLIQFSLPGIQLQAQGEAMEDGHKGQTIKVLNKASSKVITASVTEAGVVTVTE